MQPTAPPEFSRPVRIDDLPPSGRSIAATAGEREREAVARRFGLAAIARLEVAGEVVAIRGGTVIQFAARLSAEVTQTCVVTLAPLERRIEADFVRLYAVEAPAGAKAAGAKAGGAKVAGAKVAGAKAGGAKAGEAKAGEEIFFDEEGEDIEPLIGNRIDAGEAAAEQLALELDPYPRAAGASLPPASGIAAAKEEEAEAARSRPFADLAGRRLRK